MSRPTFMDDRHARFCGGQVEGFAENLRLRGEVSDGFTIEVCVTAPLAWRLRGWFRAYCPLHDLPVYFRRRGAATQ